MTQIDGVEIDGSGKRWAFESYNPWEEMFKAHYETRKLDRRWTSPVDNIFEDSAIPATSLHMTGKMA